MENLSGNCAPLCGAVGHRYVSVMAWGCRHHGAVTLRLTEWEDVADETAVSNRRELALGPFDTPGDAAEIVREFEEALRVLIEGR